MASTRRSPEDGPIIDVRDPDSPPSEQAVNPSVDQPTEGLSTMASMFPSQVVDEVQEVPLSAEEYAAQWWVIRTSIKIEDMTDGAEGLHMTFEPGVRYRVPVEVAVTLSGRDVLMEIPFPYDERRMARR